MNRALVLLPVLVALTVPAAASAGTARMVYTPAEGRTPSFEELRYAAGPGELNRFTVQEAGEDAVLVTDSAGVTLGRNCTRPMLVDMTRARCVTTEGDQLNSFSVTLGDRDDIGTAATPIFGSVSGGTGNDVLTGTDLDGGEGNDLLRGSSTIKGGPGNDDMTGTGPEAATTFVESDANNGRDTMRGGGGGDDVVSYEGRAGAIRADLDGDRDDGEAGENDQIGADVESINGGRGNDVLTGNGRGNILSGYGGSDVLTAGAGADRLYASDIAGNSNGRTNDRLDAGPGDDILEGSRGANRLSPGPGSDDVTAGAGADVMRAVDGSIDRVSCGRGRDRLRVDRFDFFGFGCERRRRRGLSVAVPLGVAVYAQTDEGPSAEIGCPADARRRCRGVAAIVYRGRVRGRKRFNIRRGRVGFVQFRMRLRALEGRTVRLRVRSRDRRGRVRQLTAREVVDRQG